jgi:hypothetical protein
MTFHGRGTVNGDGARGSALRERLRAAGISVTEADIRDLLDQQDAEAAMRDRLGLSSAPVLRARWLDALRKFRARLHRR